MVKFKDSDGRAENQALYLLSVGSLCPAKQHAQRPRAATSEPWSTALGMLTRPPTGGRACQMSISQMSKQAPDLGWRPSWDLRRARPPAGGAVAPWSEASLGSGSRPLLRAGRGGARGRRVWGSGRPRRPHSPPGTLPSLGSALATVGFTPVMDACPPGCKDSSVTLRGPPWQRGLTLGVSHRLLACKATPAQRLRRAGPHSHTCPGHQAVSTGPDVPKRGPGAAEYARESQPVA